MLDSTYLTVEQERGQSAKANTADGRLYAAMLNAAVSYTTVSGVVLEPGSLKGRLQASARSSRRPRK